MNMSGSTITTTITNAVVLASPGYATPLTITNAGAVEPSATSAIGIYGAAGISGLALSNAGFIGGGVGTSAVVTSYSVFGTGGTGGDAVYLHTGTVENTGSITGGTGGAGTTRDDRPAPGGTGGIGILLTSASASLDNNGTITGGTGGAGGSFGSAGNYEFALAGGNAGSGGAGLSLAGGETASNSGLIIGGAGGAGGKGAIGTYDFQTGGLGGNGGAGVQVAGGKFTNSNTIIGGIGGVGGAGNYSSEAAPGVGGIGLSVTSGAIVVNFGTIIGGTGGSDKQAGEPGGAGAYISGGTLINDGTIIGGPAGTRTSNNAVSSTGLGVTLGPQAGVLVIDPGSTIAGAVQGNSTDDALVLAAAPGSGTSTLHGFNDFFAGIYGFKYFDGFTTLSFASGADWSVTGDFHSSGGSFGPGAHPGVALSTIVGFSVGDTLGVYNQPYAPVKEGDSFVAGVGLEVSFSSATEGNFTNTYGFQGAFVTSDFNVAELAGTLTITLLEDAACYVTGTRIATATGEVKVEDLAIGDFVETLHAGLQKIKWIGQRSYGGRFIAGNKDILPICIKQHAIAENIPARDLFVSPGHAICIDGALIHACRLVNGVSVRQAASVESVTYYHIETENHEVIFAENCPAETFIDENFRAQFQNAAQFRALYPGQSAASIACLPRLEDGFSLHAIQQCLAARAGILPPPETQGALRGYVDEPGPIFCSGWAQDVENPETPVCLDILIDGTRVARVLANVYRADLRRAGLGSGCHGFRAMLPAGRSGQGRSGQGRSARVEIRRAKDGAELPWTAAALGRAA